MRRHDARSISSLMQASCRRRSDSRGHMVAIVLVFVVDVSYSIGVPHFLATDSGKSPFEALPAISSLYYKHLPSAAQTTTC